MLECPLLKNKVVISLAVNAVVRVVGDDVDKALKILKRKIEREGLIRDIKRHAFYEKPAEIRRRKIVKAKRKQQKINDYDY